MSQKSENVIDEKIVEKELMPSMGLDYLVEVKDKDGKLLQRVSAPSKSFVRQWYDIMSAHADDASRTCKDTGGIDRNVSPDDWDWYAGGGLGVTTYGIRVGKGTTAVTISDYKLETPIEHGTGLDQLDHLGTTWEEPAVVGSTCSFWIRRSMVNNSGSTITGIKEIGVYNRFTASYYMLGFRDVLPSAVYIPHGGSITVTYTIGVTV